jgi:hypothetical protein
MAAAGLSDRSCRVDCWSLRSVEKRSAFRQRPLSRKVAGLDSEHGLRVSAVAECAAHFGPTQLPATPH